MDAEKFYLCLNFEVWLHHTDEILNYKMISEIFKDKWKNKYSLENLLMEAYKNSVTSSKRY